MASDPQEGSLSYSIESMHAAAEQIARETNSAIDQQHELHRRAQDALGRLPGHLQHVLGQLLASTHEYCLDVYHNKHHTLAKSLHEAADAMSGLDMADAKSFESAPPEG